MPKMNPDPKDWTTASGAARILGCARSTVYDMVKRGALQPYYLFAASSGPVFLVSDVDEVRGARERVAGRG